VEVWPDSQIDGDPVLGSGTYCYLSAHAMSEEHLRSQMFATAESLRAQGIPPIRLIIEKIVYDSKMEK
jgi:hypothetical protein